ncbi:hypothetical protein A3860_00515 [Niastella vici]|uniref:Glycosyltransferase subfamily 4-like N-terminal domain-containing protein n=1 Tax=Niastella vici TaxID=1703345 RepID=A0A1V9G8U1_9BACT|nr:hypothetical protein [Niastella vici]OQP66886.1 hypothetical protein A3860_00515 [Niastella vici]
MKHILFLTSTNLACNPRCRKEVELALDEGYKVSVVAFEMDNWTKDKERQIIEVLKDVTFYHLPAGRSSYWNWLKSVLIENACRWLYKFGIRTTWVIGMAVSRRSILINGLLRKINISPDLIIAHNPGAFYPAAKFAKNRQSAFGIDVEDYHPGEGSDPFIRQVNEQLLKKVLPKAAYVSYASEPIMHRVFALGTKNKTSPQFVVNNTFAASDFGVPAENKDIQYLHFIWFSQNIDVTRGLEQVLPILDSFQDKVRLTLIGNLNKSFFDQYLINRKYVTIISSLTQEDLHRRLVQYDIGLAIEPGKDENNNLALSNKIWAYFQAGLYILATGTEAQSSFIEKFSDHGVISSLEETDLKRTISSLLDKRDIILANKLARWKYAQRNSWSVESNKLLKSWKQTN